MFGKLLAVSAFCGAILTARQGLAQPTPPAPPVYTPTYAPNDYGDHDNWLCWPGRNDACAADLTTTVIHADGKTSTETFHADPKPPIDCFYVYPTVSHDPGIVSDMVAKPEETNVVIQQAARLQAHCRLYAPMYRQFTLAALAQALMHPLPPGAMPMRPTVTYNDVKDAWNYYLAHENKGRGVVLVGHSQGSGLLTVLIKNEIDGKPAQKLLVSAILMGTVLPVPQDQLVGGAFASIPLCKSPSETGCAIAYSSFRQTSLPPPDNTRFGRVRGPNGAGLQAACVNPSNLAADPNGVGHAEAYFGTAIAGGGDRGPYPWLKGQTIATPFVSVPGLITAQCVQSGPFHVLAISLTPAAAGSPRANDIPGDLVIMGQLQPDWGLHLIDANLLMGNLVDDVGAEAKTWTAAH